MIYDPLNANFGRADTRGRPYSPSYGPVQGTKNNRGFVQDPRFSNAEPYGGEYDQSIARTAAATRIAKSPLPPATFGGVPTAGLEPFNPRELDEFGFYKANPLPPAVEAIDGILADELPGRSTDMAPLLAASDPWSGMRAGQPSDPMPGMITGTPGGAAPVSAKPATKMDNLLGILGQIFGGGKGGLGGTFGGMKNMDSIAKALDAKTDHNKKVGDFMAAVPGKRHRPITYDNKAPRSGGSDAWGNDTSFGPRSVQTSSRWTTGY